MGKDFLAIIFDCSGVVIDSNVHQFFSWKRLFDEEGVPFTMVDFQTKVSGQTREAGMRSVMGVVSDGKIEELCTRKQEIFDQLVAVEVPGPFPGIAQLLADLRSRNMLLAVASSSRNARSLLTRADIARYFDVIAVPESDALLFSDDLFHRAVKQLGKKPEQCIVVEDSPMSITEANALGAYTIGIAMITPPEALSHADAVVANHTELRDLLLHLCTPA